MLARSVWEAVSSSDVEALTRMTTDGITWHASGRGQRAGDFRGRAGILEYLAAIGDDVARFDSSLEDVLVGEVHTALFVQVTGRRNDQLLEAGFVLILRIEGERIAEIWSVARDQLAVDEFWA
jgi:ketosteroid isomerase-like protein